MNNQEEKRRDKPARRSDITRKILTQYVRALLICGAGICLFAFLGKIVCSFKIWKGTESLWYFLKWVEDNLVFLLPVSIVAGWAGITYYYLLKPFRYLDEVVEASKQLAALPETPIALSTELGSIENEMNLVREQALRSAMLAREAEQRKNDLIMYLAHDLKTPLTSVIGYLTLLRDEPQISTELRAKYTGIALSKAERLEELQNEFFDITRFNLTSIVLEKERVNLSRMVEQIASEFEPVLQEKELHFQLSVEPSVEIVCDPNKLERVLDNLIRNAIHYSYAGTVIALALRRQEGSVRIYVKNHGKTIPKEKLDHIFEQFYRLDASRSTESGGAGLGLAIAKEIAELHGGSITAQSKDEAIVFTVELPL